jgi:hypothetical protein
MTDDKKMPDANDRPEQTKSEKADQQEQQSQSRAVPRSGQRPVSCRRPLFGS